MIYLSMDEIYFTRENIDIKFRSLALSIIQELEDNYSEHELKKIKIKNLKQLVNDLHNHKPRSHARDIKKNLLKYLNHFIEVPIKEHNEIELTLLESEYILPFLNNRFNKYNHTFKWLWLFTLLFTLGSDIILWLFVGEYYYYIPITTIIFLPYIYSQIRTEIKAKKKNRLW